MAFGGCRACSVASLQGDGFFVCTHRHAREPAGASAVGRLNSSDFTLPRSFAANLLNAVGGRPRLDDAGDATGLTRRWSRDYYRFQELKLAPALSSRRSRRNRSDRRRSGRWNGVRPIGFVDALAPIRCTSRSCACAIRPVTSAIEPQWTPNACGSGGMRPSVSPSPRCGFTRPAVCLAGRTRAGRG